MMRIGKIGVIVIGLVPFNVYGECTPTPDCASIGYTETLCDGSYIKCPFDTSKLFCIPCDSSFKYDCTGENVTGGTGSTCGGKYVSCECATNYIFDNGSCICPEIAEADCLVGAIYYADGKCSNDYIACKNPVGVVVKDNALVMSWKKISWMTWSSAHTDTSLTNYSSQTDAKTDFNGKSNTAVIVAAHPTETVDNNAAIYCNSYSTEGTNAGDWYLPAAGELYSYVYGNYDKLLSIYTTHLGYSSFSHSFWSSSEISTKKAWYVMSYDTLWFGNTKNALLYVCCFLDIS